MKFNDILENGKKKFVTKDAAGCWGRCDYCDTRQLIFPYKDTRKEMWQLCDVCIDFFVQEEE